MSARRAALVIGALATSACNYAFSLDGYEGNKKTCPSDAILCDDFERDPSDLQGAWGSVSQSAGTLSIIEDTPTGRALGSQIAASDGSSSAYLALSAPSPIQERLTVRSRMRVGWSAPVGSVSVNAVNVSGASGLTLVLPTVYAPGLLQIGEVRCEPSPCSYKPTQQVPFSPDEWHDWSLVIDFSVVPARYTIEVDGALALDAAESPLGLEPGTVAVHGGAESGEKHGDFDVSIDDIVITGN